jgi:integrase
VIDFLDELEKVREVTARTRNLRLTAIHSFFRYVAFEAPAQSAQTQRVLAIPAKRFTRPLVSFLSRQEVDALLAAPDQLGGAITPSFYSRCRPGCVCRS